MTAGEVNKEGHDRLVCYVKRCELMILLESFVLVVCLLIKRGCGLKKGWRRKLGCMFWVGNIKTFNSKSLKPLRPEVFLAFRHSGAGCTRFFLFTEIVCNAPWPRAFEKIDVFLPSQGGTKNRFFLVLSRDRNCLLSGQF